MEAVVAPELAFEVEADGEAVAEILSAFEPPTVGRVGLEFILTLFRASSPARGRCRRAGRGCRCRCSRRGVTSAAWAAGAKPATAEIAEATVAVRSLWRMVVMMVSGLWCVGV